jgi:anti-sigma factor RsiW
MLDQIRNQLNAFLDGELDERGQIEVQAHLETCQACREELEALRRVSQILRTSPQPEFTPVDSFKDRLMLQLPFRDEALPEAAHSHSQLLPWMAPALVLAGWIFIQVALNLTGLISLAGQAGILDGALARAAGSTQQMQWFAAAQAAAANLLGAQVPVSLKLLNDASVFANNVVILLMWQLGAAALYWGALTLLWQGKVKTLRDLTSAE